MFRVITLFTLLVLSSGAFSNYCDRWTQDQVSLLRAAYIYGEPYDYGYTLAAITVKESFVGDRVYRMNPHDPSFGVTHIHFETIKHFSGLTHWEAVKESERLVRDDVLSFNYSIKKLDSIKGTWWSKWKGYNGAGKQAEKYANDVQGIVKYLQECDIVASNY